MTILNHDGQRLLAYNALRQAEAAEQQIATKTLQYRRDEAERMIDQAIRYKSMAIAANPFVAIDVVGSIAADLMLIRRLARLYGLPITSFEAGRLWKKLLIGTGGVLFAPIGFSLLFGWYSLSTFWETPSLIPVYLGGALLQGGIAAYSAYIVGQAAKTYLIQGATWGNRGTSTVIRSLFQTLPTESILRQVIQHP